MKFIGINDIDLIILNHLDDSDLRNIYLTNKHFNNLSNNENFWRNRVIKRFGEFLTVIEIENFHNKYIDKLSTWKSYYISLANFIKTGYVSSKRNDIMILHMKISERTIEMEREIVKYFHYLVQGKYGTDDKWKRLLNQDLIYLDEIFFIYHTLPDNSYEILFDYLLTDRRIDPNGALIPLLKISQINTVPETLLDKLMKHPKISVDKVVEAVLRSYDFTDCKIVIDKYLSFIKEQNKFYLLREKMIDNDGDNEITDDIIDYIYSFFPEEKLLSQTIEILQSKSLQSSDYIKIIASIRKL